MTIVAAVDCGTNSTRLLVAQLSGGEVVPRQRLMRVTRLGAGVDATGHLDDTALERTLDCLADYAAIWRDLGAGAVRIAATSAVRDAADRDRFFDGVRRRTGVDAEVLSGDEEAALAFAGAIGAVDATPPVCILDIGGGSTEFILGSADGTGGPVAATSRQLGCVRLTERALPGDPPTPSQLAQARELVREEMDATAKVVDAGSAATLVGVAGTATTIAALHLGLRSYLADAIHGSRVPREAVSELTEKLASMTSRERAELGPMAPGREDVIVGGALVLEGAMARFSFDEVLISESDILDGLAASAAA